MRYVFVLGHGGKQLLRRASMLPHKESGGSESSRRPHITHGTRIAHAPHPKNRKTRLVLCGSQTVCGTRSYRLWKQAALQRSCSSFALLVSLQEHGTISETHLLWDIVEVADMMERFHLLPDGSGEVIIAVAKSAGGDSGNKVKVLLPHRTDRRTISRDHLERVGVHILLAVRLTRFSGTAPSSRDYVTQGCR